MNLFRKLILIQAVLILFFHPDSSYSSTGKISGIVTNGISRIPFARVRIQTAPTFSTSDSSGNFILTGVISSDTLVLTAWAEGYFNGKTRAAAGDTGLVFILKPIPSEDNKHYKWLLPEPSSETETRCINCHSGSIIPQWKKNLHSESAVDQLVLTMYNGTNLDGDTNVEPGFKLDFPDSAGSCANCHAPTAALKQGSGKADLDNVDGVDAFGIHCDFCHKIVNTSADLSGSSPGSMSIEVRRPGPSQKLFVGSFDDVPGSDTYSPLFESSLICAPCHQYFSDKTPIYTSYTEWLSSNYSNEGIECQDCHMKPDGITTNISPSSGGLERDPMSIPSHLQMGEKDSLFIAGAVKMDVFPEISADILEVKVEVANEKTGHHFPTGSPLRNVILILTAKKGDKTILEYSGNNVVPEWGGIGNEQNDYSGMPGKGFARILQDQYGNYPAPQWRQVTVRSDTRIPAKVTDISTFAFKIPDETGMIVLNTKLIYRKAFKQLTDVKKWNIEDIIIKNVTSIIVVPGIKELPEIKK